MNILFLLPVFIIIYFLIGIIYNLIKKPKEWKELFKWIYTGNVHAAWLGRPIFFWILYAIFTI